MRDSDLHCNMPAVLNPDNQTVCHEVGPRTQSVPNLENTITAQKTLELLVAFERARFCSVPEITHSEAFSLNCVSSS